MDAAEKQACIVRVGTSLAKRARRLEFLAIAIFVLIVLLLIAGGLFSYYAEQITVDESADIRRQIVRARVSQGEIITALVPELIQITHNANKLDTAISKLKLSKLQDEELKKFTQQQLHDQYQRFNAGPVAFASRDAIIKHIEKTFRETENGDATISVMFSSDGSNRVGENFTIYAWVFDKSSLPTLKQAVMSADLVDVQDFKHNLTSDLRDLIDRREANELLLAVLKGENETFQTEDGASPNKGNNHPAVTEQDASRDPWHFFLQLNLNRFGSLAIVSVIVSILVAFYKYNLRLAAFYRARADALELQPAQEKVGFIKLATAFTPNVDFSKEEDLSSLLQLLEHIETKKEA